MYKVFLMGGVGNQLFQFSRAVSLKLKDNEEVVIHELGLLKRPINFFLGHTTHKNWIDNSKLSKILDIKLQKTSIIDLIYLFYIFVLKKISLTRNFDAPLNYRLNSKNKFDVGYFQEIHHFDLIAQKSVIRALKKLFSNRFIKTLDKEVLSLHIRGGDFSYPINNVDLIRKPNFKLINEYLASINHHNTMINIVTNDPSILINFKYNLKKFNIVSDEPLNDFFILVNSNKMFVSQSSFCYWAFLLAKDTHNCKIINSDSWVYKKLIYLDGTTK